VGGDKTKVDCPETVRWFLQRIWKFLVWTVWTLDGFGLRRCGMSDQSTFRRQKYSSHRCNARAKFPYLADMVFTDQIVKFSLLHRVVLPDLCEGRRSHKFKIRELYYSTCCRNFTICTLKTISKISLTKNRLFTNQCPVESYDFIIILKPITTHEKPRNDQPRN
jgi:hypothetical protein